MMLPRWFLDNPSYLENQVLLLRNGDLTRTSTRTSITHQPHRPLIRARIADLDLGGAPSPAAPQRRLPAGDDGGRCR